MKEISENTIKELLDFVMSEVMPAKKTKLNLDSRIYEDLDVSGDDAVDFIIAYGKRFKVDVSNFMAADYFEGEGAYWSVKTKKKTLTLGDLLKGIEHERLDEEIIKLKESDK